MPKHTRKNEHPTVNKKLQTLHRIYDILIWNGTMSRSPLQFYRDNEGRVTPAHKKLDSVLIRIDQSPPIHQVCLRNCEERSGRQVLRVDRQLLDNPLCGAAASLGWPLALNIETSAVNKGGYGLQLHPSKWRHYMWNRAERRANRLSTVTSEGPVTCRASLLYKRVSLCPYGTNISVFSIPLCH